MKVKDLRSKYIGLVSICVVVFDYAGDCARTYDIFTGNVKDAPVYLDDYDIYCMGLGGSSLLVNLDARQEGVVALLDNGNTLASNV